MSQGRLPKLYDRKTPITAADLLNDRVLPFFDQRGVKLLRVLTDRGSEYCGNPERHEYELYLAVAMLTAVQTRVMCRRYSSGSMQVRILSRR